MNKKVCIFILIVHLKNIVRTRTYVAAAEKAENEAT